MKQAASLKRFLTQEGVLIN